MENFLNDIEINTYCQEWEISEKAVYFQEIAGDFNIELPNRVFIKNNKVLNQGKTLFCVAYWTTEGVNESSEVLGLKGNKDPLVLVNYIKNNLDPLIEERGTYIENWPKWARKLGWLEGYSYIKTLEEIKKSLTFGMPIATGSKKINWRETINNNFIAVQGDGSWHFINIVWYSDNETLNTPNGQTYTGFLIVENTWGEAWGNNGYYYIPYEYAVDVLFNTKISILVNELLSEEYGNNILQAIRDKKKEKGITETEKEYKYFDKEDLAMSDPENKNLFKVLQNAIKENNYTPNFNTLIGSNEDRTNTRILIQINNARNSK